MEFLARVYFRDGLLSEFYGMFDTYLNLIKQLCSAIKQC